MKEIVIKIPDKVYDYVSREWIESDFDSPLNHVMNGVKNGIELPKGHGELKDSRIVDRFKDRIIAYGKDYTFSQEEVLNILGRYEGIYKKTYVEADKENDE